MVINHTSVEITTNWSIIKNKYYFDSENLEFVPIKRTFAQRIYGLSLFLISSVIIGSFITIILLNTDFIDTPKELVQAREIDNYEFFVIYLVWTGTSIIGTISDNYKTQSILVVFTFLYVLILNISTFIMESPMFH